MHKYRCPPTACSQHNHRQSGGLCPQLLPRRYDHHHRRCVYACVCVCVFVGVCVCVLYT